MDYNSDSDTDSSVCSSDLEHNELTKDDYNYKNFVSLGNLYNRLKIKLKKKLIKNNELINENKIIAQNNIKLIQLNNELIDSNYYNFILIKYLKFTIVSFIAFSLIK